VLFAVATLFIFLVLLHYSTVISKLTDENVELAQRIALLEDRVNRLRTESVAELEDEREPVRPQR
jgi:Uncharacterized conserved protein (DUF2304)